MPVWDWIRGLADVLRRKKSDAEILRLARGRWQTFKGLEALITGLHVLFALGALWKNWVLVPAAVYVVLLFLGSVWGKGRWLALTRLACVLYLGAFLFLGFALIYMSSPAGGDVPLFTLGFMALTYCAVPWIFLHGLHVAREFRQAEAKAAQQDVCIERRSLARP